jgi:hypothetical protein
MAERTPFRRSLGDKYNPALHEPELELTPGKLTWSLSLAWAIRDSHETGGVINE